jgi:tetratricopeptide (TPR) repeat protein
MALGFAAMLVLPFASAWILRAPPSDQLTVPLGIPLRTTAFFLAMFGAWGFVLYVWCCCIYSMTKGRQWTWGLLGLPAAISFIALAMYGSPASALLCILGLGGFLVPMGMPIDRVLLAAAGRERASATSLIIRLGRESIWVWAFGLFLGASLAYGNSFSGGMTLDNKYIIEEYFHMLPRIIPNIDPYSWPTMVPLFFQNDYWWPKGISGLYRPIAVFSFWLNYTVNHTMGNQPLDPFQFHVVNFLLHWFAACLAFVLLRQLSGRTIMPFFAAALFATHPIATESVSNIIGRSDIMAALTVFGCTVLYIRSVQARQWSIIPWLVFFICTELVAIALLCSCSALNIPLWVEIVSILATIAVPVAGGLAIWGAWKNQWTRFPWLGAMMAAMAVGLFAKESAVAVLPVIMIYDVIYRWTLEDLRAAIPSLFGFSLLSAIGAVVGISIGQFGALGLSEGLTPVLVILLIASLLAAGGLVLAWVFWAMRKPLTPEHMSAPWTNYFLPYALTIPPVLLWLAARSWVFANASPPETPFLDNPIRGLGFFAARMTASDVFLRLLGLLAAPIHLSCDYSFNQIPLFGTSAVEGGIASLGVVVILCTLGLVIITFRRNKLICFLLLFYLITYLPTSNFLIVIGSIMAERFMYLPLIAFVACVVLGVEVLSKQLLASRSDPFTRSVIGYAILAVLAVAYSVRAEVRNQDWFSDITLWTSAAQISPVSFRSYQSKAFALYERYVQRSETGAYKDDPVLRDQDIDACYETAVQAKPIVDPLPAAQNSSRLYLHLGMYYSAKGQIDGHFQPNGVLVPGDPAEKWFRLAEQVLQQGVVIDRTFDQGNRGKELARKIRPESEISDVGLPPIYASLGNAFARLGEWQKSYQAFNYQRHLDPVDADSYIGIATAYSNQAKPEEESIAILQALILDGKRTQLWSALASALAQINRSGMPAVTETGGKVQLHLEIPEVRSVLCSTYQGLIRVCLLAKRKPLADQFRAAAIRDWHFPSNLFDDLVTDPDTESPVPPDPDTTQP